MATPTVQTQGTVNNWSVAGTGVVIPKPSGTVDGDLIYVIVAAHASGETCTPPAGWTAGVTNNGGTNQSIFTFWKVASGEPSSWTFTLGASAVNAGMSIRITGAQTSSPIDGSNSALSGNTNPLVFANTITPAVSSDLLLFITIASRAATGLSDVNTFAVTNNNPSWTQIPSLVGGAGISIVLGVAYGTYAATSATGNSQCAVVGSLAGEGAIGLQVAIKRLTAYTVAIVDTEATSDATKMGIGMATVKDVEITSDAVVVTKKKTFTNSTKHSSSWINKTKN